MKRRVRNFLLVQILLVGMSLVPTALRILAYQSSSPTEVPITPHPSNPPAQTTHTVDSAGHIDWVVKLYDSAYGTESVSWVRHIYILGVAADWVDSVNTAKDINDVYHAVLLLEAAAFLLLIGPAVAPAKPHFLINH